MSSFAERLKMFNNKVANENQKPQKPKFQSLKQNIQKNFEEKKTEINNTNQIKNNQFVQNSLNNKKEENNKTSNNSNNNFNFENSMKERLKFFQQNENNNNIENKKTYIKQFPKKEEIKIEHNHEIEKNKLIFENNEKKIDNNKIENSNQNNSIQNKKPQFVSTGMSFQERMKMFQQKKEDDKKIEPQIPKINKIKNQNIFEPTKKEDIKLEKPIINKNSNFQEKLKLMSQQQTNLANNNNNEFKPKLIQNNLKSNVETMLQNKIDNNSDIKIEKEKFNDITEIYNEIKIVKDKKVPSKKIKVFDDI